MADTGSMIAGAGVIKDVGGQWLTKGVEEALGRLKKPVHVTSKDLQAEIDSYKPGSPSAERAKAEMEQMKPREALNSWIDGALRKYVLNRMATPEDEIRKLAEDGVLHVDPEQLTSMTKSGLKMHRKDTPFPSKGLGESEHAKKWENAADTFVRKSTAGDIESGSFAQGAPYVESWISKLANDKPETPVYTALDRSRPAEVGFDHIVDVLGEKLATGELRPEQLSKVSVAEAVRMAHKYNLDAAERMSKARLASQEGMTVHKEYPEGYKWVQLDKPGQFAAESDVMGHSVRGYEPPKYQNERAEIKHNDWIPASGDSGDSGYGHGGWEAIKSGKAKVYSLRDPKGESHVTVEVHKPEFDYGLNEVKLENAVGTEKKNEIYDAFLKQKSQKGGTNDLERFVKDLGIETDQQISQIKGKQNQRPEDKYLPYVQDFVRSSKWSNVGDVKNTGLLQVAPSKYISNAEVEALGVKHFGINGPDLTENAAQYYTRISRMHPSIRSKADEAFIKDVEQTADKPKAALAAGAAALGAAGAPKKPAASDQGYPSPGIIPSAVASTGSFMRNAKDTVKDWLAHPADSANELHDQITNQAKTGSMDMTAGSATTSGGQLQSAPVISEDQRAHEMADTGSMIAGAGVIKDVGGQWLTKGVEEALGKLKKTVHADPGSISATAGDKSGSALNSWIDGALRKYVLNRMATPDDEIRQLAEGGVLHVDPEQLATMAPYQLTYRRAKTKFAMGGMGVSEHARKWEAAADRAVVPSKAETWQKSIGDAAAPEGAEWLKKVSPDTPIHAPNEAFQARDLGFDHLVDVLGEKLATGELGPEQLSKVSVADAVRMAHKYNLDAAERMSKARLASQEGVTVHKEYPEGYKWVQLDKPGQFAAESDVMGHSVRGYEPPRTSHKELNDEDLGEITLDILGPYGDLAYKQLGEDASNLDVLKWTAINHPQEARKKEAAKLVKELESGRHPDWIPASGDSGAKDYGHGGWEAIKSGKAKVYSLRDSKGESHVTVEVGKMNPYPLSGERIKNMLGPESDKIWKEYVDSDSSSLDKFLQEKYHKIWKSLNEGEQISQIKGKLNKKPEDKYLPYVQDFVRSSKWGDVGDVKNTGLLQVTPSKYISDAEVEQLVKKHYKQGPNSYGPEPEESAAEFYTRISRMHPNHRSKTDEAFIKDVDQTADKPRAALAAGAAALGAAGAAEASPNEKHPVTPELVDAMIQHESSGHPHARSKKGAVGLMQLMPRTAKMLGVTDRTDPVQNRKAGTKYMQQLLNEYRGDYEKALVAYNWGPHNVNKAGNNWKSKAPRSARLYARKIMQDAGLSEQLASN
ncbi:MAG TPA: lytic transglycosylase domain-containing protein [Dehalococcoidia bacterium]|nr:lytic transglycosylase domain-containing protein [Dehalococcoidia bacterium]